MERSASRTLSDLRVTTLWSMREPVASLSGGQRQSIAVAKAVMWNSRLVILDRPPAALGVAQTRQVLELVRRLADQGLAVIMISHNLNDVFAVADRMAVLRLGKLAAAGHAAVRSADGGRAYDVGPDFAHARLRRPSRCRRSTIASRRTNETSDDTAAASGSAAAGKPAEAVPVRGSSLWDYFRAQWAVLAGQAAFCPS